MIDVLSLMLSKVYTGGITDDDAHVFRQPSIDASPSYVFVNCLSSHGQNGGNLQMFSLSEVFSKAGFQTTDGSFVVPGAYYLSCFILLSS